MNYPRRLPIATQCLLPAPVAGSVARASGAAKTKVATIDDQNNHEPTTTTPILKRTVGFWPTRAARLAQPLDTWWTPPALAK